MTKFTIENRYRLYEDNKGDYIEVGPDVDGLNMVRLHADNTYFGKCDITFEPEVALKIAKLLTKAANDAIKQQKIDFPDG